MAAWDKGEDTVWGTVLLAFPAVAGQASADILDTELPGSWVALLAGGRQREPLWWQQWWSPQLQTTERNMVSPGGSRRPPGTANNSNIKNVFS